MKKYLPIILVIGGLLVFVIAFISMRGKKPENNQVGNEDDEVVAEIPFEKRPFTTLTPTSDGHWLNLKIDKINVSDAASLDYELLYEVPDKPSQGVPGSVQLKGNDVVEQKLLLGSESSGKFRYDEGVESGTLTLRFRNSKGKLVGKLTTDFHLQSNAEKLVSSDAKFSFTLSKKPTKTYFVTMNTFGSSATLTSTPKVGPYGIFSSDATKYSGTVEMGEGDYYLIDGSQATKVNKTSPTNIGVFASL